MNTRRGCALIAGVAGLFVCLVIGYFVYTFAGWDVRSHGSWETTYTGMVQSENGLYVASRVLISNGDDKNRTLAVCNEAQSAAERAWIQPFAYGEIELTDLRWTGPHTLVVGQFEMRPAVELRRSPARGSVRVAMRTIELEAGGEPVRLLVVQDGLPVTEHVVCAHRASGALCYLSAPPGVHGDPAAVREVLAEAARRGMDVSGPWHRGA